MADSKCGTCTMCCLVLPVKSMHKPAGIWCEQCQPGAGCKIWHIKPDECNEFQCAWLQMPKCREDLRPDKCKVVFERKGTIMLGSLHPRYTIANLRTNKAVVGQIQSFLKEGFSVMLAPAASKPTIIPAPGRTAADVWQEFTAPAIAIPKMAIMPPIPA